MVAFNILVLVAGLVVLVGGAELLVRGASALAQRLGVPPLVVGLTVVAFGTSAPELAVNLSAAVRGQGGITFGSIMGSNIANVGWILALTALVRPLSVGLSVITREIPMMLLTGLAALAMTLDRALAGGGGGTAPPDLLGRGDGIVLLLLFGVFLYYTLADALRRKTAATDPFLADVKEEVRQTPVAALPASVLFTCLGLGGVVLGGQLTVQAAVKLAAVLGMPEAVVAMTLVAFGTTLPELLTSVLAVRRGQADLAIGNVIGSNIFNLTLIGGLCATIRPIPVPPGGHLDLLFFAGLAAATLPIAISSQRRVTRSEGGLLLASYIGYLAWRVGSSGGG